MVPPRHGFGPAAFSHTFTIDGSYDYFCTPHRTLGMTGTVVVQAPITSDQKLIVSGGRLAVLEVAIDAAAGEGNRFDAFVEKTATDTETARTQLASGKTGQVKKTLRRMLHRLAALRQRLGSKAGRKSITDDGVRASLTADEEGQDGHPGAPQVALTGHADTFLAEAS